MKTGETFPNVTVDLVMANFENEMIVCVYEALSVTSTDYVSVCPL